jgi:hypothetical protein
MLYKHDRMVSLTFKNRSFIDDTHRFELSYWCSQLKLNDNYQIIRFVLLIESFWYRLVSISKLSLLVYESLFDHLSIHVKNHRFSIENCSSMTQTNHLQDEHSNDIVSSFLVDKIVHHRDLKNGSTMKWTRTSIDLISISNILSFGRYSFWMNSSDSTRTLVNYPINHRCHVILCI